MRNAESEASSTIKPRAFGSAALSLLSFSCRSAKSERLRLLYSGDRSLRLGLRCQWRALYSPRSSKNFSPTDRSSFKQASRITIALPMRSLSRLGSDIGYPGNLPP
jgi:hypothetical protein